MSAKIHEDIKGKKNVRPSFSRENNGLHDFISRANEELRDALFIPQVKDVRNRYSGDFVMITRSSAKEINQEKQQVVFKDSIKAKVFLYSERYKRIVPFEKDDYLIYDEGYMRCDGDVCYYYDNLGHELGTNTLFDEGEEKTPFHGKKKPAA